MIPNLIIAGSPKCGTTSIFNWLSDHPSVCPSSVKETYFLMDRDYPLFRKENNFHKNGFDGYHGFFENCSSTSSIIMEATPDYLYQETALNVIALMPNSTRVILIFRKPSDRVYSLFQFARNNVSVISKNITFTNFIDAVMNGDPQGIIRNRPILKNAIKHSQYIDWLEPWIEKMPDKISILLFEDMRQDPKIFMKNLSSSLGIDSSFFDSFDFSPKNKTYEVNNQSMHLIKKFISSTLPNGRYRKFMSYFYRRINTGKPKAKSQDDIEALYNLDQYFSVYNDRLEELTGLDLSKWRT